MKAHSLIFALASFLFSSLAVDWPMLGRDQTRNRVSLESNAPTSWDLKTGRNVKWKVQIGTISASEPVVASELVWIGTDAEFEGRAQGAPVGKLQEAGVLAAFRTVDGSLFHRQTLTMREVSPGVGRRAMWGLTGSPYIDGNRLWFMTPTAEVVCLEYSAEDGTVRKRWEVDLIDLGIHPAVDIMGGKGICSIGGYKGYIYVITGHGREWSRSHVPRPEAPALVCLDRDNGQLVWKDNSPGTNIIFGEFGSPLVLEIGGKAQVVAPQGDGWVRSFDARTGKPLWKFDINPKQRRAVEKNFFLNAPVSYNGHVYIAGGQDVEGGEGPGRLVCLDPTGRGDLSLELQTAKGVTANPHPGVIWYFDGIGRSMSLVAIHQDLLVAVDYAGFLYCLDARTGREFWTQDLGGNSFASPLIADNKIYAATEEGDIFIFELGREKKLIARMFAESPIYSPLIYANGVLYLRDMDHIYAIQERDGPVPAESPRAADTERASVQHRAPDAVYVPTPHDVVARMLEMARVTKESVVIDLGSGDGRIPILAAERYGCKALGYEIDPRLVELSRRAVAERKLQERVQIEQEDIFTKDLSNADVITVFLYPRLMERLLPQFARLKPGTRIISHQFGIPGVAPEESIVMDSAETGQKHRVLIWTTPLTPPTGR
jgi:outer membrane protein assembly factor BamB